MRKTTSVLLLTTLIMLTSVAAQAQEGSQAMTDYIDVRVLNLEVVVTDRDGVPVTGLEPGDFTLQVDGENVPIEFFNEVRQGEVLPTGADAAPQGSPGLTPGELAPTSILVFVDEFFSIARDKNRVLSALAERAGELAPNTQVAIVAWAGERLEYLTDDWVSDPAAVRAALDEAIARPAQGLQRVSERRSWNVSTSPQDMALSRRATSRDPWNLTTGERMFAARLVDQLRATAGAAAASMGGLEAPPGRRALFLLSGGWPMDVATWVARDSLRAATDRSIPSGADLYGPIADIANLLGYTIYGIDVPGLQVSTGTDASMQAPTRGTVSAEFLLEMEIHDSLSFLASRTGGRALLNSARISALDGIGLGLQSYYWLGMTPQWTADDSRRDITIEVTDPELQVRAPSGFVDPSPVQQVEWAVQAALLQPSTLATRDFEIELGEPEQIARRRFSRTLTLRIPNDKLTFAQADGRWVAAVEVLFAAIDNNGGRSEVQKEGFTVSDVRRPRSGDFVTWETTLVMNNRTARVGVALFDRAGNRALASVVDVP